MSNEQISSGGWLLLTGWTLASLVGWAAGLAAGVLLTRAANQISWLNEDRFFAHATLVSLGITIGVAQWTVIRPYLPKAVRWITATMVGYLLCLVIIVGSNLAKLGGAGFWDDVLLLGLLGTTIGTSQWWILRQRYRKAGLWVLVSAVGFLGFVWTVINPSHSMGEFIIRGAIIGTLAAIVPGAALTWFVRQPLTTVLPGTV